MARPLRIDFLGAWHHVTSQGNESREVHRDDTDRRRFLGLFAQRETRFRLWTHGYGLMANHYYRTVEIGDADLSAAMQWLNVSDLGWFNWRCRRARHHFKRAVRWALATPDGGGQDADETRRTSRASIECKDLTPTETETGKWLGNENWKRANPNEWFFKP